MYSARGQCDGYFIFIMSRGSLYGSWGGFGSDPAAPSFAIMQIYYNILLQPHIVFNGSLLACTLLCLQLQFHLLSSGRLLVTKN